MCGNTCWPLMLTPGGRRSVGACWIERHIPLQQAPTERRPPIAAQSRGKFRMGDKYATFRVYPHPVLSRVCPPIVESRNTELLGC